MASAKQKTGVRFSELQSKANKLKRELADVDKQMKAAKDECVIRLMSELRSVMEEFAKAHFDVGAETDLALSKTAIASVRSSLFSAMPALVKPSGGGAAAVASVVDGGGVTAGGLAAAAPAAPPGASPPAQSTEE